MSKNDDILNDLLEPITWRHKVVRFVAELLGVRLYSCPVIMLRYTQTPEDAEVRH